MSLRSHDVYNHDTDNFHANMAGKVKTNSVADLLSPLISNIFNGMPKVRIQFWDGSQLGEGNSDLSINVLSPKALKWLFWSPNELGLGRAYVAGDLDVSGDIFELLELLTSQIPDQVKVSFREILRLLKTGLKLGVIGWIPRPPEEEAKLRYVKLHSLSRDQKAISHHYDVGNNFYEIILGPAMTYSCARFAEDNFTLEQAQDAKHDLVCAKLGLREKKGLRLLDIGCGWGSMAIHAAKKYEANVVGITLSQEQAEYAQNRVKKLGLADKIEIRLQDYRTIDQEKFNAVSSIGMFEHVGRMRAEEYFAKIRSLLLPGGRLCNHAISKPGGSRLGKKTFVNRYIFPDGELLDVGEVVLLMEQAGFEVRDVESLREHYNKTLTCWVKNLERNFDQAISLTSEARAKIWRLYMAASANGFRNNRMAIHQVLGVIPTENGESLMPSTRNGWT